MSCHSSHSRGNNPKSSIEAGKGRVKWWKLGCPYSASKSKSNEEKKQYFTELLAARRELLGSTLSEESQRSMNVLQLECEVGAHLAAQFMAKPAAAAGRQNEKQNEKQNKLAQQAKRKRGPEVDDESLERMETSEDEQQVPGSLSTLFFAKETPAFLRKVTEERYPLLKELHKDGKSKPPKKSEKRQEWGQDGGEDEVVGEAGGVEQDEDQPSGDQTSQHTGRGSKSKTKTNTKTKREAKKQRRVEFSSQMPEGDIEAFIDLDDTRVHRYNNKQWWDMLSVMEKAQESNLPVTSNWSEAINVVLVPDDTPTISAAVHNLLLKHAPLSAPYICTLSEFLKQFNIPLKQFFAELPATLGTGSGGGKEKGKSKSGR